MKNSVLVLFTLVSAFLFSNAMCQAADNITSMNVSLGMEEVAKIANGSAVSISLTLTAQEAGQSVKTDTTNTNGKLFVSSVLGIDGTKRNLYATVSGVPLGTMLSLRALTPTSGFVGTMGTIGGSYQILSTTAVKLVDGIGTCYTGTSLGENGYGLDFKYSVESAATYENIRAGGGATAVVTFTFSTTI